MARLPKLISRWTQLWFVTILERKGWGAVLMAVIECYPQNPASLRTFGGVLESLILRS